jgi:hypothetical protein
MKQDKFVSKGGKRRPLIVYLNAAETSATLASWI